MVAASSPAPTTKAAPTTTATPTTTVAPTTAVEVTTTDDVSESLVLEGAWSLQNPAIGLPSGAITESVALAGDVVGQGASLTTAGDTLTGDWVFYLSSPDLGDGVVAVRDWVFSLSDGNGGGEVIGLSGDFTDMVGTLRTRTTPDSDYTKGTYVFELQPLAPSPASDEPTETRTIEYEALSAGSWVTGPAMGGGNTTSGDIVGSEGWTGSPMDGTLYGVGAGTLGGEGDGLFIYALRLTSDGAVWTMEGEFFGVSGAFAGFRGVGTGTGTDRPGTTTPAPSTFTFEVTTPIPRPVNPLQDQPEPELLSDGHEFLEGIAWSEDEGALYFLDKGQFVADEGPSQLLVLGDDDSIDLVRADVATADFQFDLDGRLVATETDLLQVTATNPDGTVDVLASDFDGLKFAAPNGVVVRSDGTVYFTDFVPGAEPEFDFRGVFAISPSGTVTAVHRYAADQGPNGIALSPDEKTLYVSNTFGASVDMFDVAPDGSISAEPRQTITTTGVPDGVCVDDAGNIFVASIFVGIEAFDRAGTPLGIIAFPTPELGGPGQMTNCEVGGDDRTLFVTSAGFLYRVPLA
jgi:gluconolactonase